jgi:exopolyphosphatase/guanosine-5'-triphosphate,3'-diphosphate pyrophosphatase
MVIYEKTSRFAFRLLHEEKSRVRISEDAYKNDGNLQKIPMQRAFDALENFLCITDSFNVRKTLCVATSALRDAPNKNDFIQKIKHSLKLNIKIINGEQEAYYGALACANLLPKLHSSLSIDIGGGSTEFALIDENNITNTLSLDLGTVRLKELFCDHANLDDAISHIDTQLEFLDSIKAKKLVGIGGTFRAIADAIMKDVNYPLEKIHGFEYKSQYFEKFIAEIMLSDVEQLQNLGIKNNRFDVIKPGALILQRVIKKLQPKTLMASGAGVREGVYLTDLLRNSKHVFPQHFNTSVRQILDTHVHNKIYSNQLNAITKKIFDLTHKYLNIDKKYRYELGIAAKLYSAGSNIHFYSKNKHAYTLIQNSLEYGFSHKSIMLIATLSKYTKNKLPAHSHLKKYKLLLPKEQETNALSYIFSLSIALLSHRPRNIDFELKFEDGEIFVKSQRNLYLSQEAIKKIDCNQKIAIHF